MIGAAAQHCGEGSLASWMQLRTAARTGGPATLAVESGGYKDWRSELASLGD